MKIRIITFRRSTLREIAALESDYISRLKKKAAIELVDLKPHRGADRSVKVGKRADAKRLLGLLDPKESFVILDSSGEEIDSDGFAQFFAQAQQAGDRRITFVIGSPNGLGDEVKSRAALKLKLSALTLPHQLVRLVLIEAIYRSFDLLGPKVYYR